MVATPDQERLVTAISRLVAAPSGQPLQRAVPLLACTELGCPWAVLWLPDPEQGGRRPAAWWPERLAIDGAPRPALAPHPAPAGGPSLPLRWPAGREPVAWLQVPPESNPEVLRPYLEVAGRLLVEAAVQGALHRRITDLAQRARRAGERHRRLTLHLEELNRELDASQRRQLVLGERHRIAQDLHDRAAQTLFLIGLKADWLLARFTGDPGLRDELQRLQELAVQGAAQTREAIYALRAPELTCGLEGGLRRLVRDVEANGLAASLTVTGSPASLPAEVEDALFKMAQEALNNARRHSGGSAVMVSLRYAPEAVTLVVQDDGVGLPAGSAAHPAQLPADSRHLGLRGMYERVRALGGRLELVSGDEGGLLVRATVPVTRSGTDGDSSANCR